MPSYLLELFAFSKESWEDLKVTEIDVIKLVRLLCSTAQLLHIWGKDGGGISLVALNKGDERDEEVERSNVVGDRSRWRGNVNRWARFTDSGDFLFVCVWAEKRESKVDIG